MTVAPAALTLFPIEVPAGVLQDLSERLARAGRPGAPAAG